MNATQQTTESKMRDLTTDQKIVSYLKKHGKMSVRDICTDLDVDEVDVDFAETSGAIQSATPPVCASSFPWYAAR